jgi:hypothetical protein
LHDQIKMKIPVELTMDRAIARIGGKRVSDIVGPSPGFENCDYYFPDDNILIELKTLEEDQLEGFAEEGKRYLNQAYKDDLIQKPQPGGKVILQSADLPLSMQWEVFIPAKKILEKVSSKANRQIKATRENLNCPDAKGILLLANDGNRLLELQVLFFLMSHILGVEKSGKRKLSGIDRYIYKTINMPSTLPDGTEANIWATPWRGDGPDGLEPFIDRLKEAWFAEIEELVGEPTPTMLAAPDTLDKIFLSDPGVKGFTIGDRLVPCEKTEIGPESEREIKLLRTFESVLEPLATSEYDAFEIDRFVMDQGERLYPKFTFMAFNRACERANLTSVYKVAKLSQWSNREVVSVVLSKNPKHTFKASELLENPVWSPLLAELNILENMAIKLREMDKADSVKLVTLEIESFIPSKDVISQFPCLATLCKEAGVYLTIRSMRIATGRLLTLILNRRL